MTLESFVGEHTLSGVDYGVAIKDYEAVDAILFILDGVTYEAIEDPSDGYRSYMSDITITHSKVLNVFPEQTVIGVIKPDDGDYKSDIIQFFDKETNKLVLELGTDNTDDYYPSCIMHWYPQNLSINNQNNE